MKQKKGEQVAAVDLKISFEAEHLVLTGDGLKLRISKEDLGLLLDRDVVRRGFEDASGTLTRRIFDAEAIEKFVKIGRLLQWLDFARIGKLIGESEDELRGFYTWALNEKASRGEPVQSARQRVNASDIIPLATPRLLRGDVVQKEIQIDAFLVKRLLAQDGINAATELGIAAGDLDKWLEDNSAMMALIS